MRRSGRLALLAGCRSGGTPPTLLAAADTVPGRWRKASPWQLQPWTPEAAVSLAEMADRDSVDLVALTDGWLPRFPEDQLQPVLAAPLQSQLDQTAAQFLAMHGNTRAAQLLPVGVSPWVMVFRRGDSWRSASMEGWDVLLDPALTGQVVLPLSPRLVIELADRMTAPNALERLRRQVLTFDDRQGINWLLKDKARVLVTPLQRCMTLLRQDPRLSAVLPPAALLALDPGFALPKRGNHCRSGGQAWMPPMQTPWRPCVRNQDLGGPFVAGSAAVSMARPAWSGPLLISAGIGNSRARRHVSASRRTAAGRLSALMVSFGWGWPDGVGGAAGVPQAQAAMICSPVICTPDQVVSLLGRSGHGSGKVAEAQNRGWGPLWGRAGGWH